MTEKLVKIGVAVSLVLSVIAISLVGGWILWDDIANDGGQLSGLIHRTQEIFVEGLQLDEKVMQYDSGSTDTVNGKFFDLKQNTTGKTMHIVEGTVRLVGTTTLTSFIASGSQYIYLFATNTASPFPYALSSLESSANSSTEMSQDEWILKWHVPTTTLAGAYSSTTIASNFSINMGRLRDDTLQGPRPRVLSVVDGDFYGVMMQEEYGCRVASSTDPCVVASSSDWGLNAEWEVRYHAVGR